MLLDELLEGTVFDKLLRRRQEIAHVGSGPALVQTLGPRFERELPPAERGALQRKFFAAIDKLVAEKIPVAGYISRPGGSPVLSLLALAMDDAAKLAPGRKPAGRGCRNSFARWRRLRIPSSDRWA